MRSQGLLRDALLRLIEKHQFDKIALREITAKAGVSYPTFFNNYASKEELFQDIARQEMSDLFAAFRCESASPAWRPGLSMCAHIDKRQTLWRTLVTAGASEAMRSEFIRRGRELTQGRASLEHGFPFDLVSSVIASGTFQIIAWWLSQDEELSVGAVADMLETLVIEPALGVLPGHFTGRT